MRRPLGHRHLHVGALLGKQTKQLGRLVGGNAAKTTPRTMRFPCNSIVVPLECEPKHSNGNHMAITDWPEGERPRERLLAHGAEALSDAELLAIYLRVGVRGKSAVDLARSAAALRRPPECPGRGFAGRTGQRFRHRHGQGGTTQGERSNWPAARCRRK